MAGHISPKNTYYAVFAALMVFTAMTITVAFIDLPAVFAPLFGEPARRLLGGLNFAVAISIAITKATLVILFFMHLKYSSRLTKLICGSAFFFLIVLFGLTLSDYLSRGWFTAPGGTTGAGTRVTIGPPIEASTEQQETAGTPER